MKRDPDSGVELLGDALPYVDGAEDELCAVLADVGDRSSSSDALAARIHDWPTRYHLSRQRSNLLRPLSIRPGMRVLDVGAGTGALSRYLGERGADVVAVEGSLSRARAAAIRCESLPNVRVLCGSVDDLESEQPFDLVVVIGVLEYAEHIFGGGLGPASFLASIRRLTAPDGALALAIENQLGLKYLLGYAEDHLGVPWVGIEGYRGPRGIRTYSRRQLAALLGAASLPPRRWLYPSPDYKLPNVVLADRCFTEPDAPSLVDQLVRTPVVDHAHGRERVCDDRTAATTFVDAGLGEDVANSFLVLAGDDAAVARLVDERVLAWHFGTERLSMWLRTKKVMRQGAERWVETEPRDNAGVARQRGWLSQDIAEREQFVAGATLERAVLDALAEHDLAATGAVLTMWREHVTAAAHEMGEVDRKGDPPAHPFRRASTRLLLPDDHLDVDLANFVRDDDGALHYVDREWRALGGVDLDLALTRALWSLAHRLVVSGAETPWSPTTTVDELAITLGTLCGFTITPELLEGWRAAEDALQELVMGIDRETGAGQRRSDGTVSRSSFPAAGALPSTALRRDVVRLRGELEAARQHIAAMTTRAEAAEEALVAEQVHVRATEAELDRIRDELAGIAGQLAATNDELAVHRARVAQFEQRFLVRLYRRVTRRARPV